jgi:hypothetical protein
LRWVYANQHSALAACCHGHAAADEKREPPNFTLSSRVSLEFGYWTEEPALLEGMERFLLRLVADCEGLAGAAEPTPQFLPVDYDDEAMRETMAEIEWDEDAEDE